MIMTTGWLQFLLVVVPVMSLIGSWLALRAVGDRRARRGRGGTALGKAGFGLEGE